ncbi:MAG: hypothetical protein N4A38_04345 [Candidatus Gracilibacteria bacterium]|nr:hypothetical protein [Candidatus Gracilibacteria bacterium]
MKIIKVINEFQIKIIFEITKRKKQIQNSPQIDFGYTKFIIFSSAFFVLYNYIFPNTQWFRKTKELTDFQYQLLCQGFSILFALIVIHCIYLVLYERNFKQELKKLNNEGKKIYLENEYKQSYQPFLKGIGIYFTFFISILAIFLTFINMQFSLETAVGIANEKINFSGTYKISERTGSFIGFYILFGVLYIIGYKILIYEKYKFNKYYYYSLFKK